MNADDSRAPGADAEAVPAADSAREPEVDPGGGRDAPAASGEGALEPAPAAGDTEGETEGGTEGGAAAALPDAHRSRGPRGRRAWTAKLAARLLDALSDADAAAAERRVARLRADHPDLDADALFEQLLKRRCRQTAAIGAASTGAALVPGIGTVAAMTAGAATDITATFKLQAEMVLEIAALYGFPLDQLGQQRLIFLVTGASTGSDVLLRRLGRGLGARLGSRYAQKWLAALLPFLGVALSSGTNALSTYVIGQRARAYFRDGPEAVADWRSSLRALSGVDERRLAAWLAEGGERAGGAVREAGGAVGGAVRGAGAAGADIGGAMYDTLGDAVDATVDAAGRAGEALSGGVRAALAAGGRLLPARRGDAADAGAEAHEGTGEGADEGAGTETGTEAGTEDGSGAEGDAEVDAEGDPGSDAGTDATTDRADTRRPE